MFGRGFMERGYDGMFHGHGGFGPMGMILLAVIVIAVIYLLLKKKNNFNNVDSDILEILKRKYVEGEITEEEYVQKKNVLTNKKQL